MINYDDVSNEKKAEHNLNWPYIQDSPYTILIRSKISIFELRNVKM